MHTSLIHYTGGALILFIRETRDTAHLLTLSYYAKDIMLCQGLVVY